MVWWKEDEEKSEWGEYRCRGDNLYLGNKKEVFNTELFEPRGGFETIGIQIAEYFQTRGLVAKSIDMGPRVLHHGQDAGSA